MAATTARATKWCGASSASSSRLVRRRAIKLSRDRVDRLGFFTEVSIETRRCRRTRPGRPDDQVVEKPTGSLQLGRASPAPTAGLSFGIKQENAFGSGNYLGVQVNTSKYNRTIVFSTTDPYFTVDGMSRTIDVYHRTSQPYEGPGWQLQLVTTGASLRFGVPFTETTRSISAVASSAPRSSPGHQHSGGLPGLCQQFGYTSNGHSADRRLVARHRDSALVPNNGAVPAPVNGEWGVAATPATCRPTTSTSSTSR
jgi:outer membrane protein insertion porin family